MCVCSTLTTHCLSGVSEIRSLQPNGRESRKRRMFGSDVAQCCGLLLMSLLLHFDEHLLQGASLLSVFVEFRFTSGSCFFCALLTASSMSLLVKRRKSVSGSASSSVNGHSSQTSSVGSSREPMHLMIRRFLCKMK